MNVYGTIGYFGERNDYFCLHQEYICNPIILIKVITDIDTAMTMIIWIYCTVSKSGI